MPSNHLILCLLILLLPSIFFSIRAFSNELAKWHATSLQSCLILQPHWLSVSRLLCPWDSPDKNMGVVSLALLQLMFPTQGLNPCFLCFLHWQVGSLPLATPVVVVQSLSCVPLFVVPWTAARQASLSIANSEFTQTRVHWVRDAIQPSHPLLSPLLLPSILPTIKVFSNESVLCIGQSIGASASASILPMNIQDWFPLGWTLKSLLQHHSSKASILWNSAFFIVQLSHSYTTTGKTIALTRWTFVGKVMSLLFNMLSMLVITFLPRRKRLLISRLQSPSAVT